MTLRRSYAVRTLGCKLNQFDSASIEGHLRARGYRAAAEGETADVMVINTCTVTGNADREARQIVRRARREHPTCTLIVTGCYAELDRERLAAMVEVDAVFGLADRERIPPFLDTLSGGAGSDAGTVPCVDKDGPVDAEQALHFGERTRAFLKVQEGCDLSCSYCIIPKVRGAGRSVPAGEIERTLASLVARGFQEIVLTGVNTGDYGRDLSPRSSLASLLQRLLATPGLGRLRLNSLEPRTVEPAIVDLFRTDTRLARHLQIPLQSGSDAVLKRMYRNYRTADYRRVLEALRGAVPDIGLGADVIAGFPGETDAEFETTRGFIENSPLNYLHVFSYSDRPGTPASAMPGKVAPEVVRARSARLRALGAGIALRFRRSFVGRALPALILGERREDGLHRALTDNFIDLWVDAEPREVGRIVKVSIVSARERETIGRLAPAPGTFAAAP